MERKTGISTKFVNLNEETFYNYSSSGVTAFELSVQLKEHDALDLDRICREARGAGVQTWSYHLPFYPFEIINPASLDASVRRHTVEYLSFLIKRAASHGFLHAVIHSSGEPIEEADRPAALEYAKETLFSLGQTAKESGIVPAVEDLPRTCLGNCSSELSELISVHPDLRVCFDVNHLFFESHSDFLNNLGEKIATVHISDYDFINERHWLPGEGEIDWISLIRQLDDIGYTGVFMYEVPATAGNIVRPRPLAPADYAQNHAQIRAGVNPTPLGTPKI